MIQVVFTSGPFKGMSLLKAVSRQSAQEYIDRQEATLRKKLGILETPNRKNGEGGEGHG